MSRFSLRPLAHHTDLFEIALGWDPGLGTYFVTVFGTPDRDREPDIRLWRGTSPREIGAPCEIIAIASAYAEIWMASRANSRSTGSPVPTIRTDRQASCSKNSSGAPVQPLAEPHAAHRRCPLPGTDLVCPVPSNKGSPPMSNCYTHSCFVLHITADECGLLREAVALAQFVEDQPDAETIIQRWLGLSEAFRMIFRAYRRGSDIGVPRHLPRLRLPDLWHRLCLR